MRWDDQQRLKKALGFADTDDTKKPAAADAVSAEAVELIATVKYSGGNKTCAGCTIAFARSIPRGVIAESGLTYHLDATCWKLPATITTAALAGYEKLKVPDRETMLAMIEAINPASAAVNSKVTESAEQKAARESSEAIWKAKDDIKKQYNAWELKAILKHNDQHWHGLGPSELIDRVAEGMVNGALPKCPECKGPLRPSSVAGKIKCSGHLSAWSRCSYEADNSEVKRTKWKSPSATVLDKLIGVVKDEQADKKNAFLDGPTTDANAPAADAFKGLVFVILGDWDSQDDDVSKIEVGGGTISNTFTAKVTHGTLEEVYFWIQWIFRFEDMERKGRKGRISKPFDILPSFKFISPFSLFFCEDSILTLLLFLCYHVP